MNHTVNYAHVKTSEHKNTRTQRSKTGIQVDILADAELRPNSCPFLGRGASFHRGTSL